MNRIEIIMKIKELEMELKATSKDNEKARFGIINRLINLDKELNFYENRPY